jgi:hypothetical protein
VVKGDIMKILKTIGLVLLSLLIAITLSADFIVIGAGMELLELGTYNSIGGALLLTFTFIVGLLASFAKMIIITFLLIKVRFTLKLQQEDAN